MAAILTPHPASARLEVALRRCLQAARPFAGTIFRATGLRYANQHDLLTGAGAKRVGARWNPPGLFAAVYGSLDPNAAVVETIGTHRHYGIPPEQRMPLVLNAIQVRLRRVLDLTEGSIRRRLKVSGDSLVVTDWAASQQAGTEAITQAMGRLAWQLGLEALLVPSARLRGEKNLVLFPENLRPESTLEIVNKEQLSEK
ncbi:MAG: RES family NAD+ phosphorylase [Planctomycetes bacterium]|nr:RES family NAD+ phosphorylase [Planctomycetota bacterium]